MRVDIHIIVNNNSVDTFTANMFITLFTDRLVPALMYDSTINDPKAFATLEYLSNTVVVNYHVLISDLSRIS